MFYLPLPHIALEILIGTKLTNKKELGNLGILKQIVEHIGIINPGISQKRSRSLEKILSNILLLPFVIGDL